MEQYPDIKCKRECNRKVNEKRSREEQEKTYPLNIVEFPTVHS